MRLPVDENTDIYILDENFPIQRPYDDNFLTWFPCLAFIITLVMCGIYCCTASPCPNFRVLFEFPCRSEFYRRQFFEVGQEVEMDGKVEDRDLRGYVKLRV